MNSIGMLPTMEVQVDGMEPVPAGSMVGQIIGGRYRLTKLLGEGGMGAVYKATHINITKEVAVKLLHPEISQNPEAVTRFKQEAQSASSIGHPNIIGIDDFFALEDSRVCLIMEFLKGEPLNDVMLKPGGLEPLQTIDIMLQVCDGLHAAHQKGIIHRDMKPENVFLADVHNRQIVKILDFGIAKVTGNEDNNLTKTGTVFGTPHYMSPEQALGHKVDVRADVYSVGVMLFEIYTGQVPYQAESFMGVLSQHITSPVPAPSSISPNRPVPPMMEQIILTAMAKEVDKRFNSMEAVGNSLRAFREEMLKAGGDPLKTGVTGKMPAMDQAALAAGGGMAPPPAATPQPHAATGPHQGASGRRGRHELGRPSADPSSGHERRRYSEDDDGCSRSIASAIARVSRASGERSADTRPLASQPDAGPCGSQPGSAVTAEEAQKEQHGADNRNRGWCVGARWRWRRRCDLAERRQRRQAQGRF
jgi:serine/threonine protein kinase